MKPLVFMGAPRTRSTILFEALAPYVEKTTGQRRIKGHTELFLEFSRNAEYRDLKTGRKAFGELLPVVDKNLDIVIHFVYPPLFETTAERNLYKLEQLEMQRLKGIDHFIKCTLEVVDTLPAVLEFYKDYQFIITKRKDLVQYCLSNIIARETGLYHARADNVDRYNQAVSWERYVDLVETEQWLIELLTYTAKLWQVDEYVDSKVVLYEDLSSDFDIRAVARDITGAPDPIDLSKGNLPIKQDLAYDQIISNYDALLLVIDRAINRVSNGLF